MPTNQTGFDPDAYLAANFDPDEYLKKVGAAQEQAAPKPELKGAANPDYGGIRGTGRANPMTDIPLGWSINGRVADMGAEALGPAIGQVVGAQTGPLAPVAVPALGAIGAGAANILAQKHRQMDDPSENFKWGEFMRAMMMGAIPGASMAEATAGKLAKEGAKFASANLGAGTVESLVDKGKLPSKGEAAALVASGAVAPVVMKAVDTGDSPTALARAKEAFDNATKEATLAASRQAGYVVPPHAVNQSKINTSLGSIPGAQNIDRTATAINQKTTNELAKEALGVDELTPAAIEKLRKTKLAKPYDEVATLHPEAEQALQELSDQRFWGNKYNRFALRTGDPAAEAKANEYFQNADLLEQRLEQIANNAGKPELVKQMREARKGYAMSYAVENALNEDTGNVSSRVLGALKNKGAPLTDQLDTIASFNNAFPRYAGEVDKMPPPNVSKLKSVTAMVGGAVGAGAGSHFGPAVAVPMGVIGSFLPSAGDRAASSLLLSGPWQRSALGNYDYGTALPTGAAYLSKYLTLGAGQAPQQFSQP